MTFAAWNVIRAPKVRSNTPNDHAPAITLQHLSTQIVDISKSGCAAGNAVWGAMIDSDDVYLAFDWQEMRQGVPVLTDPNGIISNLSFVNPAGEEEPLLRQIVGLARLLHITPWQAVAVSEANKQRISRDAPIPRAAPAVHALPTNISVHSAHHMLRAA